MTSAFPPGLQAVVLLAFSNVFMHQPVKLDYLWAGLCILGAVYFIFRS
jgi:uncharacterized protein